MWDTIKSITVKSSEVPFYLSSTICLRNLNNHSDKANFLIVYYKRSIYSNNNINLEPILHHDFEIVCVAVIIKCTI